MTALWAEFNNPGMIFPGVIAAVCLLLFFWGQQFLPINYLGLALIVLAGVLFFLEVKIVSYGMLTLGGAVSLGVGLYILFPRDIPGLEVSVPGLVVLVLAITAFVAVVTVFVVRAQRRAPVSGQEGMVGLLGEASTTLAPRGKVYVRGEYWTATSVQPLESGTPVRVVAVRGLELVVEPESGSAEGSE